MTNARHCGCDPDCQPRAWYCVDFPNCAYGIELNLNDNLAGGITHMMIHVVSSDEQEVATPAPPDAVAEPADAAAEPAGDVAPEAPATEAAADAVSDGGGNAPAE